MNVLNRFIPVLLIGMVFTDMGTVMEKHTHFVPMDNLRYVINTYANHLVLKLNSGLSPPNITRS